ncbi:hypothetical protein [Epilithonimonas arachidiradicis]|uniref:hypothetical protein n=1 Tax=Epilithonimonas arachidiradicis TaxID=1617282 RepID=UPI001472A707
MSERETPVLQGIIQGKTCTKIAAELYINKEIFVIFITSCLLTARLMFYGRKIKDGLDNKFS